MPLFILWALPQFHQYCITKNVFTVPEMSLSTKVRLDDAESCQCFCKVFVRHDLNNFWEPWGAGCLNKLLLENYHGMTNAHTSTTLSEQQLIQTAWLGGRDNLREACHDQQCND